MPGQGFVDGVIHNFENHVVQPGTIGSVTDVHARALAHGLETFELLDAVFVVFGLLGLIGQIGHSVCV